MSILQELPFSLSEPGPDHIEGVGNFHLQILAADPSTLPVSTLYFLDSHGQRPSEVQNPDYDHITQGQIAWFMEIADTQRRAREKRNDDRPDLSLVFFHIPLPEFGEDHLNMYNGHRGEPTEAPSFNSHFYDALVEEGVSAIGCGHDHVNDFCALLPRQIPTGNNEIQHLGPWLCYGGCSGFGGYCSYDNKRFHRRVRVWELGPNDGSLKTWKRVEYVQNRVDELLLVEKGKVVDPGKNS
jgi:hypothetical protein